MTTPDNASNREMHLAELGTSDEDVEALLSGGVDVDELIAAGVLDDDESAFQDEEEEARLNTEVKAYMAQIEADVSILSTEEVRAQIRATDECLEANGHRRLQVEI